MGLWMSKYRTKMKEARSRSERERLYKEYIRELRRKTKGDLSKAPTKIEGLPKKKKKQKKPKKKYFTIKKLNKRGARIMDKAMMG